MEFGGSRFVVTGHITSWYHTIISTPQFGGKKFKIEIDSSIWREEIQNRNLLLDLAGRNSKQKSTPRFGGKKKSSLFILHHSSTTLHSTTKQHSLPPCWPPQSPPLSSLSLPQQHSCRQSPQRYHHYRHMERHEQSRLLLDMTIPDATTVNNRVSRDGGSNSNILWAIASSP